MISCFFEHEGQFYPAKVQVIPPEGSRVAFTWKDRTIVGVVDGPPRFELGSQARIDEFSELITTELYPRAIYIKLV